MQLVFDAGTWRVESGPLRPASAIDLARELASGVPREARVEVTPLAACTTRDGWRMQWRMLQAWLGDTRIVVRVGAVVECLYYVGVATIELDEPSACDGAVGLLATARPDFRGAEAISITDLFREDDA